jgi:hypothetical protein
MTENARERMYVRLIYRRAFRLLSLALAASAALGGIYGMRLYFIYGLTASGCLCLCAAWFTYLAAKRLSPLLPFQLNKTAKVPYSLQRFKDVAHRPAFLMDYRDFDDDLTAVSAVDEGAFDRAQIRKAKILSSLFCGMTLIALSFLVPA